MIRILSPLLIALVISLGAPATSPAQALTYGVSVVRQDVVPMSTAVAAVRRAYPGAEVLSGRLVNSGSPYYVIRILTREGRRLDVRVDARSGRVLG